MRWRPKSSRPLKGEESAWGVEASASQKQNNNNSKTT
jgi:hypothetical protein